MPKFVNLKNRKLIFINGEDNLVFLQGLITNDVHKIEQGKAVYSLMLNPQGRFLYEFFISKYQNGLILEVDGTIRGDLVKKLSFYKLQSKVEIKEMDEFGVFFVESVVVDQEESRVFDQEIESRETNGCDSMITTRGLSFLDPRKENFGLRVYDTEENFQKIAKSNNLKEENLDFYNYLRLKNKITDENDLIFNKSLIVEYGFDNLNAIDYKKGCYVGQEVVARSHYKGKLRKKIFLIEIANLSKIEKESEITCLEKKQGVILSSLFFENKLLALALIKNIGSDDQEIDLSKLDLLVDNQKIEIIYSPFATKI